MDIDQLEGEGWTKVGDTITKTLTFEDFVDAVSFVNQVAVVAEQANHHPDIDIRYNKVTFFLTTHSAGGLTDKDVALASEIDRLD